MMRSLIEEGMRKGKEESVRKEGERKGGRE